MYKSLLHNTGYKTQETLIYLSNLSTMYLKKKGSGGSSASSIIALFHHDHWVFHTENKDLLLHHGFFRSFG